MPPLVTISSAGSGRRPWSCSWRSSRYSRTLGRPSHGVYWSAVPGSSRTRRTAISSSTSVGNVSGFGNPPVIERTPGGVPARIAVSSASPRFSARRAKTPDQSPDIDINLEHEPTVVPLVETFDVLGVVREPEQTLPAMDRLEDGPLAAGNALGRVDRRGDALRRRDHHTVVVTEDEVTRRHVDAAAADTRAERHPRDAGARHRNRATGEDREPHAAQASEKRSSRNGQPGGAPSICAYSAPPSPWRSKSRCSNRTRVPPASASSKRISTSLAFAGFGSGSRRGLICQAITSRRGGAPPPPPPPPPR